MIPKSIRDALRIAPGGMVEIEQAGEEVRVRKHAQLSDLRGSLPPAEGGMSDLEAEHERERRREDGTLH